MWWWPDCACVTLKLYFIILHIYVRYTEIRYICTNNDGSDLINDKIMVCVVRFHGKQANICMYAYTDNDDVARIAICEC